MYVLGVNGGHNSTAALLKSGKLLGCISEERFSRIKNHVGFPYDSIKYLLKEANISPKELEYIIITKNKSMGVEKKGSPFDFFMFNYIHKNMFKRILGFLIYKFPFMFENLILFKHKYHNNKLEYQNEKENIDSLSKYFKIDKSKIVYADHHKMHAYSTCFNLPKNKKSLIFTLDAEGLGDNNENLCASVSIFDGNNLKRISKTEKAASLGYLYGICTLHLGMKPNEHEFKVMGLAPYSKKEHIDKTYPLFKDLLWIDDLNFKSKFRIQYSDLYLNENAKYTRFDNFAGAIQKFTEDLTTKWIKKGIEKTGIKSIGLSGGVFMNVKANQKISELPEVENIFPMPSAGDECTAIGACFYGYKKYCSENMIKFGVDPIKDLYLGPEYTEKKIKEFLEKNEYFKKYKIKKFKDIEKEIARLLSNEEVVARFSGRSEWGARALGNRSLLANPSSNKSVIILNELIKDRDFWMPFTPSILEEDLKKYIENPKKRECNYMILTFESTEKAKKDIIAAIHPYDFTVRPQSVKKVWNPEYHRLIKEFKKLTGIGAVLNTSFNLHGEPNVLSPKDAFHTLENSGLKYLAMGNYLVEKKNPK